MWKEVSNNDEIIKRFADYQNHYNYCEIQSEETIKSIISRKEDCHLCHYTGGFEAFALWLYHKELNYVNVFRTGISKNAMELLFEPNFEELVAEFQEAHINIVKYLCNKYKCPVHYLRYPEESLRTDEFKAEYPNDSIIQVWYNAGIKAVVSKNKQYWIFELM